MRDLQEHLQPVTQSPTLLLSFTLPHIRLHHARNVTKQLLAAPHKPNPSSPDSGRLSCRFLHASYSNLLSSIPRRSSNTPSLRSPRLPEQPLPSPCFQPAFFTNLSVFPMRRRQEICKSARDYSSPACNTPSQPVARLVSSLVTLLGHPSCSRSFSMQVKLCQLYPFNMCTPEPDIYSQRKESWGLAVLGEKKEAKRVGRLGEPNREKKVNRGKGKGG